MKTFKHDRYEELDAFRGIACLMIVLYHFTLDRKDYDQFFKLGTTAVDFFFMISGFVIFMSLQKISTSTEFIINRICRLYPTYWTCVSFTFILSIIYSIYRDTFKINEIIDTLIYYVANLTMFQFYLRIPDLDGPYWTMIIEIIFYVSILLLFKLKLLKYLNAIGIISISTIVFLTNYFYDLNFVKFILKEIPFFQFMPLFFAGTVFYKIYTERKNLYLNYLIIVFCLLSQFSLFSIAGGSHDHINNYEYCIMLIVFFSLFTLFVNHKLNFIINRVTLFLGKISFALYLIHQYISLGIIIPIFHKELEINFWVVIFFINLPIVIGIASFITYKIELPYSQRLKEKLKSSFLLT